MRLQNRSNDFAFATSNLGTRSQYLGAVTITFAPLPLPSRQADRRKRHPGMSLTIRVTELSPTPHSCGTQNKFILRFPGFSGLSGLNLLGFFAVLQDGAGGLQKPLETGIFTNFEEMENPGTVLFSGWQEPKLVQVLTVLGPVLGLQNGTQYLPGIAVLVFESHFKLVSRQK